MARTPTTKINDVNFMVRMPKAMRDRLRLEGHKRQTSAADITRQILDAWFAVLDREADDESPPGE